jgi:hypothetical protein
VATQLLSDVSVIQSVRRYKGQDLIWFGEWTSPDGWLHNGGSKRTVAYQRTSTILRTKLGISEEQASSMARTEGK